MRLVEEQRRLVSTIMRPVVQQKLTDPIIFCATGHINFATDLTSLALQRTDLISLATDLICFVPVCDF